MVTGSPAVGKRNADAHQESRYRLRGWLWDNTSPAARLRVASCGRKRISECVSIRAGGGASSVGGVSTCGSVWACPVCSAKVARTRSEEVQDAVRAWQAAGGTVVLATLTLSHGVRHRLADTWDAVGHGWASVRNGAGWKADCREFRIGGYVRVVEVTRGRHGWHPHVHVLLFVTGTATDEEAEALRGRLFARWSKRLARKDLGYKTLEFDRHGNPVAVDVRVAKPHDVAYLAEYLAKFGYAPKGTADGSTTSWDLAREVSRGDLKKGRSGSRTPWEILESAATGQDWQARKDRRLWAEWELASRGRRQYAWAEGFRESLDLSKIRNDAEVAASADADLVPVALLRASAWADLVRELLPGPRLLQASVTPRLVTILREAAARDVDDFQAWMRSAPGMPSFEDPRAADLEAVDLSTGEIGTGDRWDPMVVPGRRTVTYNYRDQVRRESRSVVRRP